MWVDDTGRRWFTGDDHDCTGHVPGDRHVDGNSVMEWTIGNVWTPVCPADDVPMGAHDGDGWLCCVACGLRAVDVAKVG